MLFSCGVMGPWHRWILGQEGLLLLDLQESGDGGTNAVCDIQTWKDGLSSGTIN